MQSFLTATGLALLQVALKTATATPTIKFTGLQVGASAGFTPDASMNVAQGVLLVDSKTNPSAVRLTQVVLHEMIVTAILDRSLEFKAVGNVLFFANNIPFLWLVADDTFPKLGLDPIAHFGGDECYLSIVFRFPFVKRLIDMPADNRLHAKLPVFPTTTALTVPQHTLADQCVVEQNNLYYGRNNPFFAVNSGGRWLGLPIMGQANDKNFYKIDGGTTKAGL